MEEAWTTVFKIVNKQTHFLIVKKDGHFSYNMVLYKTYDGAKKGARAAFNKINKDFEKIFLK